MNDLLAEAIFQRPLFSEIMAYRKQRNKERQKDASYRNQQKSGEEHAHRSRVELPSSPLVNVQTPERWELPISFFINLSEFLGLGPCIFDCDDAQDSLYNSTGAD